MPYVAPYGAPQGGDGPPRPPVVHQRVTASKEFFQVNPPDSVAGIAQKIINHHVSDIAQFILGMRQQGIVLTSANKSVSFADLDITYQRYDKQETIWLTVYPQAATSASNPATAPLGLVFEIDIPFTGWPILAYVSTHPGWIEPGTLLYGNYLWDNGFTPTVPTATDPTIPNMAANSQLWQQVGVDYPYSSLAFLTDNNQEVTDYDPKYWGDESLGYHINPVIGFPKEWWVNGVAGSGICSTALAGQQYWEIEIVKLPTDTPPSLIAKKPYPYDGTYNSSDSLYIDPTQVVSKWPSDLKTFVTPSIGLVPKNFVDPTKSGNYTQYGPVIGQDPDPVPAARSLGLQRTKIRTQTNIARSFDVGAWYTTSGTGSNNRFALGAPNPYITPVPETWIRYSYYGTNKYMFQVVKGITNFYSGVGLPPVDSDGDLCLSSGNTGIPIGDVLWKVAATATLGWLASVDLSVNGPLYLRPSKFIDQTSTSPIGDVYPARDATDNNGNLIMTTLHAEGEHFAPILGRPDMLLSMVPAQTIPLTSLDIYGYDFNACWSGIDFGVVKEGDYFMMATDTKTREVWFGKNGKWWDKTGATDKQPGQLGFPGALLMDGDATVDYFPACSYRLGPVHMRMRFGTAQKYPPPGSFTTYNSLPDVPINGD